MMRVTVKTVFTVTKVCLYRYLSEVDMSLPLHVKFVTVSPM